MSNISRVTLPEEFHSFTGSQLLIQPEPQYFYAQLLKGSFASLAVDGNMSNPGRDQPSGGAGYSAVERDRLLLASGLPELVFQAKVDFKGRPGHTMQMNRPAYTNSTYTESSRQIAANTTISTTPQAVGSEQNTLTLIRVAGPYNNTNSAVEPYAIENFDASMGVHDLYKIGGHHLKRDFDRFCDAWVAAKLDGGSTTVRPEGMTADNDATAAGQFALDYETLTRTSKEMDEADLPRLPNGRRLFVCTPTGKKQLIDDPQFARYAKEQPMTNPLATPTWFGSTPDFDCYTSNTLTTADNASSVEIHTAHAIAPGALWGGMGRAPSVRTASDDNYGETPKVIWLADMAVKLADNRFVKLVKYTEDAQ